MITYAPYVAMYAIAQITTQYNILYVNSVALGANYVKAVDDRPTLYAIKM